MRLFVSIVKALAFILAATVWSTVGLAMWVALVSSVTAIATLQITASLIGDEGHGKLNGATKSIEETAAVWYRGFTTIVDGFYVPRVENPKTTVDAKEVKQLTYQEQQQLEKRIQEERERKWTRVVFETGYSVCFYGSIYLAYYLFWAK
jgi:hypothetical protein